MSAPQPAPQFKIKQRKREIVTKLEPEVFRDNFVDAVTNEDGEPIDIEKYAHVLELNADKLDYKKYAEPLFELLLVGGLIAPGGTIQDGPRNPYSVFACADDLAEIRVRVDIMTRTVRRYKYLQRRLEETMAHLLQYVNKFADELPKFAKAFALFVSRQLLPLDALTHLLKEHLVKEGVALEFMTCVFQAYVADASAANLQTLLRKSQIGSKLLDFFPAAQRSERDLKAFFASKDLANVAEFHSQVQQVKIRDIALQRLHDIMSGGTPQEAGMYAKEQQAAHQWTELDTATLLWEAAVTTIDFTGRTDQVDKHFQRVLQTFGPVLAVFCTSAKTELTLLLRIQHMAYEDARLQKHFRTIVSELYQTDVLSESAIIYWFQKGASPQGKSVFIKQMEPFIQWLQTAEDDDSEEE